MSFWARKLSGMLLAALGATLLVSIFLDLIPGDPVALLLGEQAQRVDVAALRHQMWLDRPLPVQAWLFLRDFTTGALRTSLPPFQARVADRLEAAAPRTALLAALALLIAVALALPLGILSARRAGRAIDRGAMALAILGVSAPSFLVGHLLIVAFGIRLGLLPIAGDDQPSAVILPALTLGLALSAVLSRVTRAALLEAQGQEFVLAARARGLPERRVILRYALRSALLPILTIAGLQFGGLLTGAVVVEKVFNWPGLGTLLLGSIERRDFNSVRACVLVFTLTYLVVNLATDALCAAVDPRARASAGRA